MTRVFIGIPTINRPDFVRETIASVLRQTYTHFEVIVSDNGSDAGVAENIIAFIDEIDDPRIRFCQQPENLGEYGQGRFFFGEAGSSEYFMILHDDDLLGETYLERAIERLDERCGCAFFISDAEIIDQFGERSDSARQKFLRDHGRLNTVQGEFSILEKHLDSGFAPISGTLFRTEALKKSGFVDERAIGNFPFECEVFLGLCDSGAIAWYQKEDLLVYRFHSNSLRHHSKLMENEAVVNSMIRIFSCREYLGPAERRRRKILGRLYRAKALISVRSGSFEQCRDHVKQSFKFNIWSIKLWLIAPVVLIAPRMLSWLLPALPAVQEAPQLNYDN